MKFVSEYRDKIPAQKLSQMIFNTVTRPWTLMEVCGGQTHAILRFGIDELLPKSLRLVHGPGCPVCVTPTAWIDKALEIASGNNVIFCSFGDMLRVPGSKADLFSVKARGGDVRIVYSPLDALKLARANPTREVVFFAVGFETTAPATAQAAFQAKAESLRNFSLLVCHVLVPPAMEALLGASDNQVQGFLAAGHVCTVMGYDEYEPIARRFQVPIVVTGFEPIDILEGVYLCVKQLEEGRSEVENQYSRSVRRGGNPSARSLLTKVFGVIPRPWRGLGEIPRSGLGLSHEYRDFDAEFRFGKVQPDAEEESTCISGLVLRGIKKPTECPAFGALCRPEHPLGATMVSSEGACAAYYRYRSLSGAPSGSVIHE
ncbi:MAG: hydrogenase formation protein HypD [Deltaproteobacteria bacterium]|nr:hydrogenase formation protein HypD [Deltaproteobacteria bacterium]